MWYTQAAKTNLLITLAIFLLHFIEHMLITISSHSYPNLPWSKILHILSHTFLEYEHSKNKWLWLSIHSLQSEHLRSWLGNHLIILSWVSNLPWIASHSINECLGMQCVYQTSPLQIVWCLCFTGPEIFLKSEASFWKAGGYFY